MSTSILSMFVIRFLLSSASTHGKYFIIDFVGFVGCVRNVVIQGQYLDPINLMEKPPSEGFHSGLILDGCKLIDQCQVHHHCQHGGRCLSDWDGVSCDCSSSAYQGKYCQFCMYICIYFLGNYICLMT